VFELCGGHGNQGMLSEAEADVLVLFLLLAFRHHLLCCSS
jgi:hypothetical protein